MGAGRHVGSPAGHPVHGAVCPPKSRHAFWRVLPSEEAPRAFLQGRSLVLATAVVCSEALETCHCACLTLQMRQAHRHTGPMPAPLTLLAGARPSTIPFPGAVRRVWSVSVVLQMAAVRECWCVAGLGWEATLGFEGVCFLRPSRRETFNTGERAALLVRGSWQPLTPSRASSAELGVCGVCAVS